jgi:hypothetical protein
VTEFLIHSAMDAGSQICRKHWTTEEVLQLRKLVRQNTPAQVIASKLGRNDRLGLRQSFTRKDFSKAHAEFPIKLEWAKPSVFLSIQLNFLNLFAFTLKLVSFSLILSSRDNLLLNLKSFGNQSM